ncbi:MAG: class I SAM-dependent methyltransferase [Solirubrobacteraceae bacterium]
MLQPRILAPEKVEAARVSGALRLNVGCGHIPVPGYVNVDMRDLPGVDVLAETGALPFEPGSVDEISSAHLLEHFPQEEVRKRVLPHWAHVLKPGGRLRAVVPDGEAMLAGLAQGSYGFEDFREVLFGSQDYDGDFHYNLLTPDTLCRLVEDVGFTAVEVPVRGRRNGQCFEFELVARGPAPGDRR